MKKIFQLATVGNTAEIRSVWANTETRQKKRPTRPGRIKHKKAT